jgi:prolyl 4-hydroxylase
MTDAQYQTALGLYGEGRPAEGAQLLGQAARGGHVPSMSLLGHQMLSGRGAPRDPGAGVRLILAAAAQGGGMACALTAALLAIGVTGRPEWALALDYLRRGAELGFPMAQAQLRILAGQDGDDWAALHNEIDIAAWLRPPEARALSAEPRVQAFEGAANRAVCEWIIARSRDRLKPATVYDNAGADAVHEARSNSAAELGLGDVDLVVLAVCHRLAAAAGLPASHLDAPQVLHYAIGESFRHHVDYLDPAIPINAHEMWANGQRSATALVYLNDEGLEGGETDFPLLDIRHRGARGDALVFFNVDAAGQPDKRTVHAGLPPSAGEKWLLSQWIRSRPRPGGSDPRLMGLLTGR